MNIFQDIVSVASDIASNADKVKRKQFTVRPKIRSISAQAVKDTYYFPVLCGRNVSPDTGMLVSRNLERVYTSFLKACFAMMPVIEVKDGDINIEEYLNMFHQNIGLDYNGEIKFRLESADQPWTMFPNDILNEATLDNVAILMKDVHGNLVSGTTIKLDPKTEKYYARKVYNETEYKKISEMVPSYVEVTVGFLYNGQLINMKFPIAVKTQFHPLDPVELNNQIMDVVAGKGILNALIRWTTGEMLSLKDILFGVDRIKKSVANKDSDVQKWFSALERRKRLATMSQPLLSKRAFLPNASVVITVDDVEYIKRECGMDMLEAKTARRFMNEMFILSLVVVDEISENLYVIYDGHQHFEEYTYAAIERENSRYERDMSNLIKILTKHT